jgi:hypothetical protein
MGQVRQTGRFVRRWWPAILAIAVMAVVAAIVGLLGLINATAHNYAQVAQQEYAGDEIEALVRAVQDEGLPLPDRNHAVWALGQFRDASALPILERYYTGGTCQHDKFLCQDELRKAIDLCSGKTRAPRWLEKTLGWMHPQARGKA